MLHKEKIAGVIVDQTLARLPQRARAALGTGVSAATGHHPLAMAAGAHRYPDDQPPRVLLPGLSGTGTGRRHGGCWRAGGYSPRPMISASRGYTASWPNTYAPAWPAPTSPTALDTHLEQVSRDLADAATPDTVLLGVTATTLTGRLTDGRQDLAKAARQLIDPVQQRLDLTTAQSLATATLTAAEYRAAINPDNPVHQLDLAASLLKVGDVLAARGDSHGALGHHTRALHTVDRLSVADPGSTQYQRDLSCSLDRVGDVLVVRGDTDGALEHYTRSRPHPRAALRRRPRQHPISARPHLQPRPGR